MHKQMSFLQLAAPPGAATVWPTLDKAEQAEVLRALARLIAKAALEPVAHEAATRQEEDGDD